jgi:hypothetical protein
VSSYAKKEGKLMKSIKYLVLVLISFSWAISNYAVAEGCDDSPFLAGEITYQETPAGPKILAPGVASVDFDDSDEVIDATMEATMEAKAAISKFFSETIQSDSSIETATLKTVKIVGDQKTATKEKVKLTLKSLSSHSAALLRGVVKLAECYTKGDRVMVSVGLKPETIAAAEAATGAIGASVAKQPTTTEATAAASTATSSTGAGSTETECTDTASAGTGCPSATTTGGTKSFIKGEKKLKEF